MMCPLGSGISVCFFRFVFVLCFLLFLTYFVRVCIHRSDWLIFGDELQIRIHSAQVASMVEFAWVRPAHRSVFYLPENGETFGHLTVQISLC